MSKQILVLGAGLVSRPLVRYLLERGFRVTVAALPESNPERLVEGFATGRALPLDIDDRPALEALVRSCDLAVSLLPAPRHPQVARMCLSHKKHLVTTSYVSPDMRALDKEARQQGLIFLNEIGVDPGTDHMSAMKVIHEEQRAGGTLLSFVSWCGGLPSPECNDNPFGYKFSWSPRGVLVAARNSARFLRDGRQIEIPAERLFAAPESVEIPGVGIFEGYPNRDSLSYINTYSLDRGTLRTMFRGTLRNAGHCRLYAQLIRLGLLEDAPRQELGGRTYLQWMESLFGVPLHETIPARLQVPAADSPIPALEHIGLLEPAPMALSAGACLDVLVERMSDRLTYGPGERDMLVMRHDLTFSYDQGKRVERVTAILAAFGIPHGDSAMARTVSLPAAIGARLILEGRIQRAGVLVPVTEDLYHPILQELSALGITFHETRHPA